MRSAVTAATLLVHGALHWCQSWKHTSCALQTGLHKFCTTDRLPSGVCQQRDGLGWGRWSKSWQKHCLLYPESPSGHLNPPPAGSSELPLPHPEQTKLLEAFIHFTETDTTWCWSSNYRHWPNRDMLFRMNNPMQSLLTLHHKSVMHYYPSKNTKEVACNNT